MPHPEPRPSLRRRLLLAVLTGAVTGMARILIEKVLMYLTATS